MIELAPGQYKHDPHDLKRHIREVPDFPKPGILFKDISPLLSSGGLYTVTRELTRELNRLPNPPAGTRDKIMAFDARGFIFGSILYYTSGKCELGMIRKGGKLPGPVIREEYGLEYREKDTLEIQADAITPGQHVILVDDVLASGGTARAGVDLIEKAGGKVVACLFVIELEYLKGRDKLSGYNVVSLVRYDK